MVVVNIDTLTSKGDKDLENRAVANKGLLFVINSHNGSGVVMVTYIGLVKRKDSHYYLSLKSGSLDIRGQPHNFYPNQVVPIALWGDISQFRKYKADRVRVSTN